MAEDKRGTPNDENEVLTSIIRSQRILLRDLVATVRGAGEEGVTLQQAAVLRILARRGPAPMYALGEELMVSRPNITGIVDRMEGKGLVKRVASAEDRRRTEIVMTRKGVSLQRGISQDYRESLRRRLETLTEDEGRTLSRLLEKLADRAGGYAPSKSQKTPK